MIDFLFWLAKFLVLLIFDGILIMCVIFVLQEIYLAWKGLPSQWPKVCDCECNDDD